LCIIYLTSGSLTIFIDENNGGEVTTLSGLKVCILGCAACVFCRGGLLMNGGVVAGMWKLGGRRATEIIVLMIISGIWDCDR
jgi:hypothetical protein